MKPVREPGAGNPHAGFDEKERETEETEQCESDRHTGSPQENLLRHNLHRARSLLYALAVWIHSDVSLGEYPTAQSAPSR